MRRFVPALFLFLCIQMLLLWALDLRDLPGAAGTETLYKAALGERKENYTVLILQWIAYNLNTNILFSSKICSLLSGTAALLGAYLAGKAISDDAAQYTAMLCAGWAMLGGAVLFNHLSGDVQVPHLCFLLGLCVLNFNWDADLGIRLVILFVFNFVPVLFRNPILTWSEMYIRRNMV